MSGKDTGRRLEASLKLRYASGLSLADDRVRLLKAIGEHGSITRAAGAVGISYRTAWERVESLNNLAEKPLVTRATGGRGGGGTRLTPTGERLLALYHRLADEHRRFLDRLSKRIADPDPLLATIGGIAMQTSARNQFHGRVSVLQHGAVNAEVAVAIGNDHTITAIITEESVDRLGLAEGADVVAIVKASNVILSTETDIVTSARNRLCGTVSRLSRGAVNSDVVVDLGGGRTVGAIITNVSADRLGLGEQVPVCALIKASHVILATPG